MINKKYLVIALATVVIIGSLATFYGCNYLFSDISNYATGSSLVNIFVNFPIVMFAAMMVSAPLFLLRLYQRPKTIKRLTTNYLIIAFILSLLGFVGALVSGIVVYKSFLKPYPFPGYLIIGLIFHLIVMVSSVLLYFLIIKQLKEDEEKFKVTPKYVFYTFGMFLFISLMYNRLGGLLLAGFFMTSSTWLLTLPLYLWLVIPFALLTIKAISIIFKPINLLIPSLAIGALNIIIFVPVIFLTLTDTLYVSSVSPLMPLERLISMPIETIVHFIIIFSVSLAYVLKEKKKLNT